MPDSLSHWISPFIPVVLMMSIVITNHVLTGQRNDRKTAAEASRFSAALAAELRAMLDLYKANLDLIEQQANYLLSTRSSIAIYKGNLGRLTALLAEPAIGHVVGVFAQNERIEAIIAAHSNLKCNLTYQFLPADAKFAEWRQMYQQASQSIASTCQILESGFSCLDTSSVVSSWRDAFDQLFNRTRVIAERRWSAG